MNFWYKLITYVPVTETVFIVHGKNVCCALRLFALYSSSISVYNKNISLLRSKPTSSTHFYCFYCAINMWLNSPKTFKKCAQCLCLVPTNIILGQKGCRIPSQVHTTFTKKWAKWPKKWKPVGIKIGME